VGSAEALVPRGAGCVERHRMALEALRTSTKVPGCRSCSKSLLRAAKPSQEVGWLDVDETFDEGEDESEGNTGGGPIGSSVRPRPTMGTSRWRVALAGCSQGGFDGHV